MRVFLIHQGKERHPFQILNKIWIVAIKIIDLIKIIWNDCSRKITKKDEKEL